MRARLRPLLALTSLLAAACAPDEPPVTVDEGVELAVEGVESLARESGLMAPLVEAAAGVSAPNAPGAPAEAARRAQSIAPMAFAPAGCATARAAGDAVVVQLTRCQGTAGLRDVTGTFAATFARSALRPSVTLRAADLRANGGTLTLTVTAEFDFARVGVPVLRVDSTLVGVNPRGFRYRREGAHTFRWERDTGCVTADGGWSSGLASATVTSLRRCGESCPEPGGMFRLERGGIGEVVTLRFPGGSTGLWRRQVRGVDQGDGTFAMACQN